MIYYNGLNFPQTSQSILTIFIIIVYCKSSWCLWDLVKHQTHMLIHIAAILWSISDHQLYQYQYTISNDSIELNRLKSNCARRWIQIFMRIVKLISYIYLHFNTTDVCVNLIPWKKNDLAFIIGQMRRKMVTKTENHTIFVVYMSAQQHTSNDSEWKLPLNSMDSTEVC